jgi:hypothetical protein
MRLSWKNSLMARQIIEKAIKSLHERKSDSFGLLPLSLITQNNYTLMNFADTARSSATTPSTAT